MGSISSPWLPDTSNPILETQQAGMLHMLLTNVAPTIWWRKGSRNKKYLTLLTSGQEDKWVRSKSNYGDLNVKSAYKLL